MIVLLDLEWIEKNEKFLTQLSAVRTDENWNVVSSMEIFVKPSAECFKEPSHMAFGGIDTDLYRAAFSEKDCMRDLDEWLESDDEIWVWAKSNKQYFADLWYRYIGGSIPRTYATAFDIRKKATRRRSDAESPYTILALMGENPPYPEHRASNDTEVMRRLFSRLGIQQSMYAKTPAKTPQPTPTQRERNQKMIDRTEYNFLFLKNSEVFHRRTCKACLCARSESEILGSVYYDAAAMDRRPCKLCKPEPQESSAELIEKDLARRERKKAARKQAAAQEIVKMKMLTGEVIPIKRKNVLGWCHHKMHKGAVNRALLEEHDCLGKNCPFLERNSKSSYWDNLAAQQKAKEELKKKLREKKRQQAAEDEHLVQLSENWQSYLDDMESDMYIVRVAKDAPSVYRIFYVSDNSFADGNRYPDFLDTLKFLHPHYRINLRHIRDVDGHFVTTDEYLTRARK